MAKMTGFIIALCYLLGALLAYRALALLTRPAPPEGASEMKTSGARAAAVNLSYALHRRRCTSPWSPWRGGSTGARSALCHCRSSRAVSGAARPRASSWCRAARWRWSRPPLGRPTPSS
ncbi:hypothetical protein [Sorangium sp. So ce861]|uniref:hypothetical protein n=1 Tax=Sorangium sp. So ce861 TaxID=3133323 RepID=UPI003F631D03